MPRHWYVAPYKHSVHINKSKIFPRWRGRGPGGIVAPPENISITKDPGWKNSYKHETELVTFDETLHAALKWWKIEKSLSQHLSNLLVRRDFAIWVVKMQLFEKIFSKVFQTFNSAVQSSTSRDDIAQIDVGSQNLSKSCNFGILFLETFDVFSTMVDFWPLLRIIKVFCRKKIRAALEVRFCYWNTLNVNCDF